MNIVDKAMIFAIVLLVAGCGDKATDDAPTTVQPPVVQLRDVVATPQQNHYTFPAEVSAVKTLDLSFEVSGRLVKTDLLTGSTVKKGALLAAIDGAPFLRKVKEAQAKRDQALRERKRLAALIEKNLISRSSMDKVTTELELAEIALQKAKQDLSYTKLYAPFDAQVSERLVDNSNFVSSGQTIATLQDMSRIFFTFNVPERLITNYKDNTILSAKARLVHQTEQFDIVYVEHSTAVDPITQTYEVVFAMNPIAGRNIPPGARGIVDIIFASELNNDGLMIPFSALIGSEESGFSVFKFDATTQQVQKLAVKPTKIVEGYAVIRSELKVGDKVVAAGANQLSDGMVVRQYQGER
ncbi:efflux RND transporter periplasmic adaptor subunit [Thalassotalea maritima]|uniref:efflux RND transporter periplasmic adaptor subunit n=1 Tax=Thalassotalea maritima TaxID=3242416 RepID=UPI003528C5C8